ncbi:MAG: hypothetical protein M1840_007706 [Geoglossum simile]|nr:MAG: hypothetical protein M1840_007706 [Geoglossum simile]
MWTDIRLLAAGVLVLGTTVNAIPWPGSHDAILHVASYDGKITTLSLKSTKRGGFDLTPVPPPMTGTEISPSWLILKDGHLLYSVDEGLNATVGRLTEYRDNFQGKLVLNRALEAPVGGVHGAVYAGGKALADSLLTVPLPPYSDPGIVSTYRIDGELQSFPAIKFDFGAPGPNPSRQEAPHPHQIIVDPTGDYVLVPDLGSDLVHVFNVDKTTLQLSARDPLQVEGGSGPRHGVFGKDGSFFYLVAELANSVMVYKATALPDGAGMKFDFVQKTDTFAGAFEKDKKAVPSTAAASEIALSPCGSHIVISNRKDNFFSQVDAPADSLATYSIDPQKGTLSPIGIFSAAGPIPRQFALNKKGNLAAVGLQGSGEVAIIKYDDTTGKFGDVIARVDVGEQVVCVIWDE